MLGPIEFVNAACKANVEYRQKDKLVFCDALREIKVGEELAVFYFRHCFGRFVENCLCPHKTLHGDPCPRDPEPARKRKKLSGSSHALTPQGDLNSNFSPAQTPIRKIFLENFPPRRALYKSPDNPRESNSEEFLLYESFFADVEGFSGPVKESFTSNTSFY